MRRSPIVAVLGIALAVGFAASPADAALSSASISGTTATLNFDGADDNATVAVSGGLLVHTASGGGVNSASDWDTGTAGDQTVTADGTFTVVLNGGDGNDSLTVVATNTEIASATLNGDGGNDVLTGAETNDTQNGGPGNDRLVGFRGNDAMNGGDGDDTLVWNNGDGTDVMQGGAGTDTPRSTVDRRRGRPVHGQPRRQPGAVRPHQPRPVQPRYRHYREPRPQRPRGRRHDDRRCRPGRTDQPRPDGDDGNDAMMGTDGDDTL